MDEHLKTSKDNIMRVFNDARKIALQMYDSTGGASLRAWENEIVALLSGMREEVARLATPAELPGHPISRETAEKDDIFMMMAASVAQLSQSPEMKVGVCIVNVRDNVVSTGYNRLPPGCAEDSTMWLGDSKHYYIIYGAVDAISNAERSSLKGCRLYTTMYPNTESAKAIALSGVNEVVYWRDNNLVLRKPSTIGAKELFDKLDGITVRQHELTEDATQQILISQEIRKHPNPC